MREYNSPFNARLDRCRYVGNAEGSELGDAIKNFVVGIGILHAFDDFHSPKNFVGITSEMSCGQDSVIGKNIKDLIPKFINTLRAVQKKSLRNSFTL